MQVGKAGTGLAHKHYPQTSTSRRLGAGEESGSVCRMMDYLDRKGQGWLGGGVWGQGWLGAWPRACAGPVKRKESSALWEAHTKLQIKC